MSYGPVVATRTPKVMILSECAVSTMRHTWSSSIGAQHDHDMRLEESSLDVGTPNMQFYS
jgi:hypothetical protein